MATCATHRRIAKTILRQTDSQLKLLGLLGQSCDWNPRDTRHAPGRAHHHGDSSFHLYDPPASPIYDACTPSRLLYPMCPKFFHVGSSWVCRGIRQKKLSAAQLPNTCPPSEVPAAAATLSTYGFRGRSPVPSPPPQAEFVAVLLGKSHGPLAPNVLAVDKHVHHVLLTPLPAPQTCC